MSPRYILDTNICIYITKSRPPQVLEKFTTLSPGSVGMSMVTWAELRFGALRSQNSEKAKLLLDELSSIIPVLPFENEVADHYAEIRAHLAEKGLMIGNNDLWIAAHVRCLNKILVSNNLKEFERVPGLKLENWV